MAAEPPSPEERPCHSLTGYGGGIERKQHLLAFERRVSGLALL